MLGRAHHEFLLWGHCNQAVKSKYNTNLAWLISKQVYLSCVVDWTVLNTLGCAEIIEEMLEIKIVEFDEEVTDEELITKKMIKFRLGGRGHSLSLLEFARHLGMYTSVEIREEGFEVYFQGGLTNDDYFNANYYWLSISSEDELRLSRSSTQTIRSPIMRALAKFVSRLAKKMQLLTDEVLDGLSAPIYYRSLDATTLRELIGPKERLIAEDPEPGVSRIAMPRPHLYHTDRHAGIFEYMVGHYGVPLAGAYAPPGYDEEQ
ncbi:hypothetical protein Tco_0706062 [Tanacetum coccineum]|uniref:Uncharacterized protein n=1 Tax=Tanacetum coccineum TaxID=301880 RepID=A0ABQ4Y7B4_9ASTR